MPDWLRGRARGKGSKDVVSDTPTNHYLKLRDGARIAYQTAGEGPLDLLVLHSSAIPMDLLWDDPVLVRIRDRLSRFSRNIWMEFRGWGSTDREASPQLESEGEQIAAVVDAVGCQRVAIFGTGVGGPRAIRYVAAHPEDVSALVLFGAYASYVRDDECPWGFSAAMLERLTATAGDAWGTGALVDLVAPSRAGDDRFREWFGRCERLGSSPDYAAERIRARFADDVRSLLPDLHVPTLVVHRRDDRLVRVDAGRYLAQHIEGAKYVELPGEDNLLFAGDSDAVLDEMEEHLTGIRTGADGDVTVSTVLFTDIVNSTQQQAALGHRPWSNLTAEHDAVVRGALQRHRGREIKTTGDGFLATFDSAGRAIRCATDIITGAHDLRLDVRAGVHTGEVEFRDNDISGLAVSISKRVCDLAAGGEILVTDTVRGTVAGTDINFDDRGEHQLKGVPGTWHLLAVRT
jgi:class 3 adenylate cyclase